jgi:thiosulfate dehydrogenase
MQVASRWLKANRWTLIVMLLIAVVYFGAIAVGMRVKDLTIWGRTQPPKGTMAWVPPAERDIPAGELGESIRRGALLFGETPLYAGKFTHSKITCANCHAEGGIQPYSSPMVGVPATFPQFNQRAGHVISLKDRIQECFVRSENGTPLSYEGPEMTALVNYISWLSSPRPDNQAYVGRGLVALPELKPDPVRGGKIYDAQCAGCHGSNGQGRAPLYPPLWGPYSFNDGAGMNGIPKMAAYVQHNMPQNRMGILSAQDAYDVAGFVHAQPRPAFNQEFKHF